MPASCWASLRARCCASSAAAEARAARPVRGDARQRRPRLCAAPGERPGPTSAPGPAPPRPGSGCPGALPPAPPSPRRGLAPRGHALEPGRRRPWPRARVGPPGSRCSRPVGPVAARQGNRFLGAGRWVPRGGTGAARPASSSAPSAAESGAARGPSPGRPGPVARSPRRRRRARSPAHPHACGRTARGPTGALWAAHLSG